MVMCKRCGAPVAAKRLYCSQKCYHEDEAAQSLAAFWDRVEKTATCWLWKGQRRGRGYGVIAVHHRKRYAHRMAWELTHGPIPEGLQIMHICDNPPCVNPAHLQLGSPKDNSVDAMNKGRLAKGYYRVTNPKLTPAQVTEIRRRAAAGEGTMSLSRAFGLTPGNIWKIKTRRTWLEVA